MPVWLGAGVPLFPAPFPAGELELRDVTAWGNGVVRLLYGRFGEDELTNLEDE